MKKQRVKAETEREQIRRKYSNLTEETLMRIGKLKFPGVKPSVFWAGGREVTLVAIDWGTFTNDEIANYFPPALAEGANRPQGVSGAQQKRAQVSDWRANLTRLAVMRLLSQFPPLESLTPGETDSPKFGKRNSLPAENGAMQPSGTMPDARPANYSASCSLFSQPAKSRFRGNGKHPANSAAISGCPEKAKAFPSLTCVCDPRKVPHVRDNDIRQFVVHPGSWLRWPYLKRPIPHQRKGL